MQINYEEINGMNYDIEDLYKFFVRNKKFIGLTSIIFLIISILFGFSKKKVWEGGFEIVLEANNKLDSSLSNLPINRLEVLNDLENKTLKTQVGILNSSSILMPIFNELINSNNEEILNFNKRPTFKSWKKNNLKINLKKGTSILEIFYKDTNKERILPVLNKMTNSYQTYSGKSKKRSIELTKQFLTSQIDLYKNKSSSSLKKAQEYAVDQNLSTIINFGFANFFNQETNKKKFKSPNQIKIPNEVQTLNIENVRIQAANNIKNIDLQIEKIKNLSNNYKQLEYIGSTIPILVQEGLPAALKSLDEKLTRLRVNYNDNDESIIKLIDERKILVNLLRKRAIGILGAQRLIEEANKEAASRPKGVLLKYKELLREAARDESTLINLENQLRTLNIEEAKKQDPWELITNPTLSKEPVGPKKLRIISIGILFGIITGGILALYKENKTGKLFTFKSVRNLLEAKISSEIDNISTAINFLEALLKSQPERIIKLVTLGDLDPTDEKLFKGLNKRLKIEKEITNFEKKEIIIILSSFKSLYIKDIKNLKNIIELYELDLRGLIII